MQIFTSKEPLLWGQLDLPLCALTKDWFGSTLKDPSVFTLAQDEESLWFISVCSYTAGIHPNASPGQFTPELWKYDVAELFLANPTTGQYLEFNLTSNSAWWASKFSSVRVPFKEQPDFTTMIRSHHNLVGSHQCLVSLEIPLNFLKEEIDFGTTTSANITFIRDSPSQLYLSASKLPGDAPDFHQPFYFPALTFKSIRPD